MLSGRNLLSVNDLSSADIELILDTAASFADVAKRPIKKVPTLRGRTIVNLFLEPSTRTRTSFELAGKRLSADVINISAGGSALKKGESLKDTAKTIEAMAADAVIIRHQASGAAAYLASTIKTVVINGGDGRHEHPTQALLDLYTIRKHFPEFQGLRVGIVGDIANSRVARSLLAALKKMGARTVLAAPPTLLPPGIETMADKVSYRLDEILDSVDIFYLLRIQRERLSAAVLPSFREYASLYGMTRHRLQRIKQPVKIMHPGPLNRGVEIDTDVADGDDALITNQVSSGVAVRMAVLYLLLGGDSNA